MKNLWIISLVFSTLFSDAFSEIFLNTPIVIPKQRIFNIFDSEILGKPKLEMIINQKAKINGKWYQIGQKVSEYQIIQIQKNSIVLKNFKQTLTLYTQFNKKIK
ncbi:hypothetical protein BKH41_08035 [Helicobacter sp. 12S02232-10]|uniref:hypothetical protein n=1 Tax=Helicobacter sp. 12S02232-10 TaxID=1476197 RepID=UPI000BA68291|nr:hypothetical protein [Helicobacter sp. 12S02232-10]PAF47220.1 hypothetical protein BKH41_08035 [Helicobacter sp. 12S02232-10]